MNTAPAARSIEKVRADRRFFVASGFNNHAAPASVAAATKPTVPDYTFLA